VFFLFLRGPARKIQIIYVKGWLGIRVFDKNGLKNPSLPLEKEGAFSSYFVFQSL